MKLQILIVVSIVMMPLIASGQSAVNDEARTGSFYSGFGFGSPYDIGSTYTSGMGVSGVSIPSSLSPSISNPAHWGLLGITQGSVSFYGDNYRASDNFSSSSGTKIGLDNFQFVFPLVQNTLGVSLSITPITRADYSRLYTDTIERGDFLSSSDYDNFSIGSGGVNRFEIGLGYQFSQNFSIGYAGSIYLLSLSEETVILFDNPQLRNTSLNRDVSGYAMGNRFGMFAQFRNVFRERDHLYFGGSASLPVQIGTDRSITTFRAVGNRSERVELNEGSANRSGQVEFPLEINTGVTYYFNQFNSLTGEILIQNWSEAEYSYDAAQQGYFTDRKKIGVGYQYHAFYKERESFFNNFRYSAGISYDTGHLTVSGQDIRTARLHAGITIPSQQSRSSIDLSFNYGVRGTESMNLVKENVWGFKLSLNLAEFMFIRSRFQ